MKSASITLSLTAKHLQLLEDNKIFCYVKKSREQWFQEGQEIIIKNHLEIEPYTAFQEPPHLFSMGSHSYSNSTFAAPITIGRYCSIGRGVKIMPPNHPVERLSSSGMDSISGVIYDQYLAERKKKIAKVKTQHKVGHLSIGHDVWIGNDVILRGNITIGHGAVIGTRAVVTKNVPPYAVVAGIPSVVKKYRFPKKLRNRLLKSEWWSYDLADFCHLDTTNPEKFLREFEKIKPRLKPYNPTKINIYELLSSCS